MVVRPQFEELDFRNTELGDLILRRRTILALNNVEVYEIILGDDFLMTSLFTDVEIALSNLGLQKAIHQFPDGNLDVMIGGLGLGYTAKAALEFEEVRSLRVVDYLQPVIEWHEQELVPLGRCLNEDSRCEYYYSDFFKLALADDDSTRYHAILLDIDHSPSNLLHERHADFYSVDGLKKFIRKLHPGGVFAMWSDHAPNEAFMNALNEVFAECKTHKVEFYNPHQDTTSSSTVYVAAADFDAEDQV